MIVIINYGLGNLGSILNMLKKIGVSNALISSDCEDIARADKLILPGVGAFDHGMKNLNAAPFIDLLNRRVLEERIPILGLCLGLQLFCKRSDEGQLAGLGWIDAETVAFDSNSQEKPLRIPHMGWNYVQFQKENPFHYLDEEPSRFYFVHSYHLKCNDQRDVLGLTDYGYLFPSMIWHDNIVGTQFHPEKSHKFGMNLLKRFAGDFM
jgi:imidazole glycerol-phosphate synthase subunit HisH